MNSKQINARAKAAGGYVTVPVAGKNYVAEAFYHHAMVAEFDRMLAAVQRLLKRHYTAIRMQNAPYAPSARHFACRKNLVKTPLVICLILVPSLYRRKRYCLFTKTLDLRDK